MIFESLHERLDPIKDSAQQILEVRFKGEKPRVFDGKNLATFVAGVFDALNVILREPKVLFFALLQWVAIGIAYIYWTRMLDWIPASVWNAIDQAERNGVEQRLYFTLLDIALTVWSFVIVAAASYPIAIFSGAIVAARNLRTLEQPVDLWKCLTIAEYNIGRLWAFSTVDDWITVRTIFARLPKRHNTHSAMDELLYYAWKIGTIGVVPALIAGKGYLGAARDSVKILEKSTVRAIETRLGYSMVCWIVGVAAYCCSVLYILNGPYQWLESIYSFYLALAVPIVIAVGIVAVLVRPFYLMMIAKLYTDVLTPEVISDEADPVVVTFASHIYRILFLLMVISLTAAYFFGDQLGIRGFVEDLARRDLAAMGLITH